MRGARTRGSQRGGAVQGRDQSAVPGLRAGCRGTGHCLRGFRTFANQSLWRRSRCICGWSPAGLYQRCSGRPLTGLSSMCKLPKPTTIRTLAGDETKAV